MKKLALFLVLTLLISSFTVFADEASQKTYTNEEILQEILYAYYRKGTKVHYDMNHEIARRQITASPEDITSQRRGFLDCSGYASAAYAEAFGTTIYPAKADSVRPSTGNFRNFARDYAGKRNDVVGYWKISDYTASEEKKEELKNDVMDDLKVGDAIVVRYPNSKGIETGHVLVHVGKDADGDDIMLHCYGGTSYENTPNPIYSYDTVAGEETEPSIRIDKVIDFFENPDARYYFYKPGKQTIDLSILRPLARANTIPTAESLKRMEIKGLAMEKTSQPHEHSAVNAKGEITYTFTLENKGSDNLANVPLTDILPSGLTFKEGSQGVSFSNGVVTWTGNINAGEAEVVSYTAVVNEDVFPGYKIESKQSDVNGVALGNITHTVSGLTSEQLSSVAEKAKEYALSNAEFENGVEFAKAVYQNAIGAHVFDEYLSEDEILTDIIDEKNYTCKTGTTASEMLVPNLYGGKKLVRTSPVVLDNFDKDRTRLVSEAELSVGDIIIADYSGGSVEYIYAGNKTLVSFKSGKCEIKTIGDNIYENPDNILISLFAYERFAVLRPSMADLDVGGASVSDLEVSFREGAKLEYTIDEALNKEDLKVVAVMSDGTKMEVTTFAVSPGVFTYPGEEVAVTISYRGIEKTINVKVGGIPPMSVSEALSTGAKNKVKVKGIVAGVASDRFAGGYDLLIKDENSNAVIGVRNAAVTGVASDSAVSTIFGKSYKETFGYEKGDLVALEGNLAYNKVTAGVNYNSSKLVLSVNYASTDVQKDTIIKSAADGSTLNWDMEQMENEAIVIDEWADMTKNFREDSIKYYKIFKFTGGMYATTAKDGMHLLHNNAAGTTEGNITTETRNSIKRKVSVVDEIMELNLGSTWKTTLFGTETKMSSGYPGTFFEKDFYAMYTGGGRYYFPLVILDEGWVENSSDEEPEDPTPEEPNPEEPTPEEPEEAVITGISVTTKPTKLVYTVGESINKAGMVVAVNFSDGTKKTITDYAVAPEKFTEASESVTVTVSYEGFTDSFTVKVNAPVVPDEPEETDALSVSKALVTADKTAATVRGIVVGVAYDKINEGFDLLLKDENSNAVIGVRNEKSYTRGGDISTSSDSGTLYGKAWNADELFGFKKGQIVELTGTVNTAYVKRNYSTEYNKSKKVLTVPNNYTSGNYTIVGNPDGAEVIWDLEAMKRDAITINSQEELAANFKEAYIEQENNYYQIYKLSGMYAVQGAAQTSTALSGVQFIHNVKSASTGNEVATEIYGGSSNSKNRRKVAIIDDIAKANLGENWKQIVFGENDTTGFPGKTVKNEFYAMYTGGGSNYFTLVVLDESWIVNEDEETSETKVVSADNTSVTLQIGKAGDYDIVIADYEGNKLNQAELLEVEITQTGEITVPRVKNFILDKGDKVMLFKDFKTLVPISSAFIKE